MAINPPTLASLPSHERIEQLRRRIASIPARTDGVAAPAVPVEQPDARFDTRESPPAGSTLGVLPAPAALAALLPKQGLACGTVISVNGASSVLLSLIAAVTSSGKHVSVIGLPKLGLLAATEMGADLNRCALVPTPGDAAIEVAAILLDGMDLVVLGLAGQAVPPTRARAVIARARSKGSCLVVTEGRWDNADVRIDSRVTGYAGLGQGRGRITGVTVDVEVSGRGFRPRSATLDLSADNGTVDWTSQTPHPAPLHRAL
ncbi:hypothetical protein PXH69_21680 [Rhodococcus qingshengii]|uniref:Recombinase A n=1 Tax=Rhodococcus qingshengii TaxID=334542 RepID=A0AAW6LM29_RHOSG|nr:hypothetical protein [Rhodococcus qingshengii]MDE8647589.1 hypothetical protein [Rhodococcus qingshengii]